VAGPGASKSGYKARYVSGFDAPVGSATLPQGSVYAVAACGFSLLEAMWMRSGAAAGQNIRLQRLTTLGTPGATQAAGNYDGDFSTPQCLPVTTHTVAPTLGDRLHGYRPATSISQGWCWTFRDEPVEIPIGTANGLGILPTTASGAADVTFVWEE
jgi:hypothetical protein